MTAPELVVPGSPADWLPQSCDVTGCTDPATHAYIGESGDFYGCVEHALTIATPIHPARPWLAVEKLPVVRRSIPVADLAPYLDTGPLRADDTVTLATEPGDVYVQQKHRLFAEATVAEVLPIVNGPGIFSPPCVVIYEYGIYVWRSGEDEPEVIDLPDATPGGWALRLTDVKETT